MKHLWIKNKTHLILFLPTGKPTIMQNSINIVENIVRTTSTSRTKLGTKEDKKPTGTRKKQHY